MDPMFMEASLFVASDPLEVRRSGPSSQVGPIEASSGSHVNGPSSAKAVVSVNDSYVDIGSDLSLDLLADCSCHRFIGLDGFYYDGTFLASPDSVYYSHG
ncbi:hypothetical protein LWI28_013841 [Acer negundo]|uniref:Uncharacterized protein n=1 Tax=Acer negundo TaxID=4023 RepID=A0AAD5NJM4_ACENE|nr:hypothetical protein LWI28_013841 [Acer negundo]